MSSGFISTRGVLPFIPPAGYDRLAPASVGKDEQQGSERGRRRLVGRERGTAASQHVPAPVPVRLYRWTIDAIGA
jgi:hypothetical protein